MPNVDQQATTKSEPQMDGQVIFHGQSMMTTFANQNFQATRSATQNRKKLATQVADAGEIGLLGQKRAVGRPRKAAECETAADVSKTNLTGGHGRHCRYSDTGTAEENTNSSSTKSISGSQGEHHYRITRKSRGIGKGQCGYEPALLQIPSACSLPRFP